MIYSLLKLMDKALTFNVADAHCDIPCKIYDPITAQLAALSVIRFIDLIKELETKATLTLHEQAQLVRLISEKDSHAAKVKEEVAVIWGDYFKQPQLEKYPDSHQIVHTIMTAASACKQQIERGPAEQLLRLVNQFSEIFWCTKGIATYSATCPYPPSEQLIYPVINAD